MHRVSLVTVREYRRQDEECRGKIPRQRRQPAHVADRTVQIEVVRWRSSVTRKGPGGEGGLGKGQLTRERNVFSSAGHSGRAVNYGDATSKRAAAVARCKISGFEVQVQNDPVDQTSAPTRAAGSTGSSRIAESVSSAGRSQTNMVQLSAAGWLNLICFGQVETTVARFTTVALNNQTTSVQSKRGRSERQFLLDKTCSLRENCLDIDSQFPKIATSMVFKFHCSSTGLLH